MNEYLRRDSVLPPYLMFPRFLLDSSLSETAKLLYMVLLDRARLSQQNQGWTDDRGRVFLHFPIKALGETLHKSDMTVKTALAALEQKGLIVRERRGVGQGTPGLHLPERPWL
jgi:DNA-binding MarR family transcriptional regulator